MLDVLGGLLSVIVDAAWYVLSNHHVHGVLQRMSGRLAPEQRERYKAAEPLSHLINAESLVAR